MSDNSKTLRNRAAKQLKSGRKAKDRIQKGIHNDRAAAFKAMAHDDEWLTGERERSQITALLSVKQCVEEAQRCRALARKVMTEPHRVMLTHIANTWDRIAGDVAANTPKH